MSRQRLGKSTTLETPLRTAPGGITLDPSTLVGGEGASGDAPTQNAQTQTQTVVGQTNGSGSDKKKKSGTQSTGFLGKFGAIELENKGSVARDHLALERTFLAWLRTSLAFASIGVAITQLFRLNITLQPGNPTSIPQLANVGKFLGATFVGISMIVLALGAQRYYESQGWLLKGKFPASRGSIYATALIAFLLIIASLVIVLTASPASTEL